MLTDLDAPFAAARALMLMIDEMIEGAILVDREARLIWSNTRHVWFGEKQIAALGRQSMAEMMGEPVERVLPHSRMREVVETGQPMPLDIMCHGERTLLVSRLPLRDERGRVVGGLAFALKDSLPHLLPVADRLARLQMQPLRAERSPARARPKYSLDMLVGASPAMVRVKQLVRRAAATGSGVLLLGETGTGKEVVAQAIHAASERADRPFVAVNVAAIPDTLLEAEFFGVAPGAYTGAGRQARPGRFQRAHGGTLFLDEIGDMPLLLQAKLLRTLQEREVEPLGSGQVVPVDVRVIAATSRPLAEMVAAGTFRRDLYYRLNVFPIHLPALRARGEDLDGLVAAISARLAVELNQRVRPLTASALERLAAHDWPGNVRELANVIEQVYVRTEGERITADDLADILPAVAPAVAPAVSGCGRTRPLAEAVDELERTLLVAALAEVGGNRRAAAQALGLSRTNLYAKLQKHGLAETMPAGRAVRADAV